MKKYPKLARNSTPNGQKSPPKHDSESHKKYVIKLIAKMSNVGSELGVFFAFFASKIDHKSALESDGDPNRENTKKCP